MNLQKIKSSHFKKFCLLAVMLFVLTYEGHSQCIATLNSPTGTVTVSPYIQTCLSSNMFPGSYTSFSVTSAGQYAILTSFGTQVTVTDNLNNPLASGFGVALYTNILTPGVYRVHIHNTAGCSTGGGSRIVCVAPRNNAFNFDGVNDHINLGTAITNSLVGKNVLTAEAWVFPTSNTIGTIVGNHSGPSQFNLRQLNNNFNFFVGFGSFGVTSVATVSLNTWQHVAGVLTPNSISIYVNGVFSGSTTVTSFGFPPSTIPVKIAESGFGERFVGNIDEVRLWNRALCLGEIQNNMNGPIPTTAPGLMANYHFNQGVAGGSNSTVTTLVDDSGNSYNGTVTNAALTGATSNWVGSTSYPDNGSLTPFVSPSIVITGTNAICSGNSTTLTASGNVSTYTWVAGPSTATLAVTPSVTTSYSVTGTNSLGCVSNMAMQTITVNTTPTVSVNSGSICSGSSFTMMPSGAATYSYSSGSAIVSPTTNTSYTVTGTSAEGCSANAVSNVSVNICAGPGEALAFDGVNDFVDCGIAITNLLKGLDKMTVEAWIYPTQNTVGKSVIGNHQSNTQFNIQHTINNQITFFIGFGTYAVTTASNSISLNTWQHVAGVFDDNVIKVYINGVLSGTTAVPSTYVLNTSCNTNVWIGKSAFGGEEYRGKIDEVRIWNRAVCQGEIINNMNGEIPTTANGLVANYHFNQGVDGQPNPSITTLNDASGNSHNGTLTGFALTGTVSNWVAPGSVTATVTPYISPTVAVTGNTAVCNGNSVTLTANGNVTSYAWVSGPTTASNVVTPTVTTSYSVTGWNLGCPSNEATYTVQVNALPVVSANTSNTIICGPPFQGTATLNASGALTYTWSTSATGSNIAVSPSVTTNYTVTGTDANGCENNAVITQSVSACTGIHSMANENSFLVYPNPNNGILIIEIPELSNAVSVSITNLVGEVVFKKDLVNTKSTLDIHNLNTGVYFVELINNGQTKVVKIIKD